LVEAGEKTGNVDRLFGDFIRHDLGHPQIDAAFRAVLRVSAHSMLQHDVEQAKLGWSHCLTLPQSAFGLSSVTTDRKLALAAALVWITAYRSVLSDRDLDLGWQPQPIKDASVLEALQTSPAAAASRVWHAPDSELSEIRRILATEASIRNDVHLVKYTRACLDMGVFDPEYIRLSGGRRVPLRGLDGRGAARDNRRGAPRRPHHALKRRARSQRSWGAVRHHVSDRPLLQKLDSLQRVVKRP